MNATATPTQADAVYRRPALYAKQQQAIFDPADLDGALARYSFIEASTKAGKTAGCMAWLFEQAILDRKQQNFWWVAPVYGQAKIAYRRFKRGIPKGMFRANDADLTILLPNGTTMWFKSAEKPDNLYGDDVAAAVLDEASRMREEAWHAIRSTLTATRGPMRAIGNVKGRRNWFYKLARRAQQGERGMAFYKLTAYDAVDGGVLDIEEIEDAKRTLPEHIFRELYLAEPSDDGGNPFGLQHIEACTMPMSDLEPVAIGIDVAQSVDWNVAIGLDIHGRVCGFERWQKTAWSVTQKRIIDIVGSVPSMMDATGVGKPVWEGVYAERSNVSAFFFTAPSKQLLLGQLAVGVQAHEIGFPPGPIADEMSEFEYVHTRTSVQYSAPEGYHDDCVMALALAWNVYQRVRPLAGPMVDGHLDRISPWFGRGTGIEHGDAA